MQKSMQPFILDQQQIELIKLMNLWWQNQQTNSSTQVLSQPLHDKSSIILMFYFLQNLSNSKKHINILYLTDTRKRSETLYQICIQLNNKYIKNNAKYAKPPQISNFNRLNQQNSQITIMSFRSFVRNDLPHENIYNFLVIQTSNLLRTVRDGFGDYITDTYLRKGYIQALRLEEAYRQSQRNNLNKPSPISFNLNKKKQDQIAEIISIVSKDSESERRQQLLRRQSSQNRQNRQIAENSKKSIRKTYELKKQQLLKSIKNKKQNQQKLFQSNQLILISSIIYLIGFLYTQIQVKRSRNFAQFLQQYRSRAKLTQQYLEKVPAYFSKVFKNCPNNPYQNMQQTYLYAICQFIKKIVIYKRIFENDYRQLFEIKYQKFPLEKRDCLSQQSASCLVIGCNENNKICNKLILQKTLKCLIIQNFACPAQYWFHIFKRKNMLINPQLEQNINHNKFSCLYGLHISKTPSNQDLDFSEKLRSDIETIKIKACGVLLEQLSKFTPDGIVVYFHSLEGLENFFKQMDKDKDQQRILKRIDSNKKIFVESPFQQINKSNYEKFKKSCDIGRGAIFLMAANTKSSQYMKFYNHLSRCIVFFGLPKNQKQIKRQPQIRSTGQPIQQVIEENSIVNIQKHAVFNQYINNCVNSFTQYKSIIFVGRQISNDLENWYKTFIRSWDQTTRESLIKLRNHFQKMGCINRLPANQKN